MAAPEAVEGNVRRPGKKKAVKGGCGALRELSVGCGVSWRRDLGLLPRRAFPLAR